MRVLFLSLLTVIVSVTSSVAAGKDDGLSKAVNGPALTVHVSMSANQFGRGEEIPITVTVSATDDRTHQFSFGSFGSRFGAYILGPWGPLQPAASWMHGEIKKSRKVVIKKGQPFSTTFTIQRYFRTEKPQGPQVPGPQWELLPGKYQVNVKFFVHGLGPSAPIDSVPIVFTLKNSSSNQRDNGNPK